MPLYNKPRSYVNWFFDFCTSTELFYQSEIFWVSVFPFVPFFFFWEDVIFFKSSWMLSAMMPVSNLNIVFKHVISLYFPVLFLSLDLFKSDVFANYEPVADVFFMQCFIKLFSYN